MGVEAWRLESRKAVDRRCYLDVTNPTPEQVRKMRPLGPTPGFHAPATVDELTQLNRKHLCQRRVSLFTQSRSCAGNDEDDALSALVTQRSYNSVISYYESPNAVDER